MTGIQMLTEGKHHPPDASLLLLTAYAGTEAAIKAIDEGLDYYLLKRVASAVGEGAMSIFNVHRYLATT